MTLLVDNTVRVPERLIPEIWPQKIQDEIDQKYDGCILVGHLADLTAILVANIMVPYEDRFNDDD